MVGPSTRSEVNRNWSPRSLRLRSRRRRRTGCGIHRVSEGPASGWLKNQNNKKDRSHVEVRPLSDLRDMHMSSCLVWRFNPDLTLAFGPQVPQVERNLGRKRRLFFFSFSLAREQQEMLRVFFLCLVSMFE